MRPRERCADPDWRVRTPDALEFEPARLDGARVAPLTRDEYRRPADRHVRDGIVQLREEAREPARQRATLDLQRDVGTLQTLRFERGVVLRDGVAHSERPQALVEGGRPERAVDAGAQRGVDTRRPGNGRLGREGRLRNFASRARIRRDAIDTQAAHDEPAGRGRPGGLPEDAGLCLRAVGDVRAARSGPLRHVAGDVAHVDAAKPCHATGAAEILGAAAGQS